MVSYTFGPQPALDIATAQLVKDAGLVGQVYAEETGGLPLSVTVAGGVVTTNVGISSIGQTQEFSVEGHAQVYWRSGPYTSHLMSFDGIFEAFENSVRTVNGVGPDEDGDVEITVTGGIDDAGVAALVSTPTSALALALAELYGVGVIFLDLDEPRPPDLPVGTIVYRVAGGTTPPPVPIEYMRDDFERVVAAGSIGAPSSGGSYSLID